MSEFRAVLVSTASTTYRSAFLFSNLATEELLPHDLRGLVSWGKAKTGGASPSPRHPAFAPGSAETPKPRCTPFGRVTPTPLRTWFCALCSFNAFANNPRPARDRDVFEATEPPRRVLPVAFTSPRPVHGADGAGRPAGREAAAGPAGPWLRPVRHGPSEVASGLSQRSRQDPAAGRKSAAEDAGQARGPNLTPARAPKLLVTQSSRSLPGTCRSLAPCRSPLSQTRRGPAGDRPATQSWGRPLSPDGLRLGRGK